ncbi:conserved Plasmodium protein, unknown function [Plasmodium ovale wallikeri]|uniref:Uncharacterized protein n=1 Tax=Plasmodium ovale wallikeri TaxID=864142 RepID=A0A1A8ZBA3_PLAOA|nr:conserved Plasmodium protein, unknown function [Plasmodium ovale wallikeri]SBT41562.1 conserved Plasmodium protein, unknown function [Plasmodium ovale wallikeri]
MGIQGSILRDDVPPVCSTVTVLSMQCKAKCLKKKEEILNGDLKILIGTLNDTITLNCGHGQSIHILDASYGNPSIDHFLIKKGYLMKHVA